MSQQDKTVVLIADGLLWDHGIADAPGALRPDAKRIVDEAVRDHARVVVVSYCASTHEGAKRCRSLLERELGHAQSRAFDLHVSCGFPVFDKIIHGE